MDRTLLLWENKRSVDALTSKIRPLINWSIGSLDHIMNYDAASIGNDSSVIRNAFYDYQFNGIIRRKRVDSAKENLSLLIDYILSTLQIDEDVNIMKFSLEKLMKESFETPYVEDRHIISSGAFFNFVDEKVYDQISNGFDKASSLLESEHDMTIFDFIKAIFQQGFVEEVKNKAQSCANVEEYDTAEKIIFNTYNYPSECKCRAGFHGEWCDQQNECTCRLGIASNGTDCPSHGLDHCQSCNNPDHDRGSGVCSEMIHLPVIDADLKLCSGHKTLHNDFGILRPMGLEKSTYENNMECSWNIRPTTNSTWEYRLVDEHFEGCDYDWVTVDGRKYCSESLSSNVWKVMDSGSSLQVEFKTDHSDSYYRGFTLVWMPSDENCLANTTCSICPKNEEYRKYSKQLSWSVNDAMNSIIMVIQK